MSRPFIAAICAVAPVVAGCASPIGNPPSLPPPRSLNLPAGAFLERPVSGPLTATDQSPGLQADAAGDILTLDDAINRVLANSPDLAAAADAVRAKEEDARQAALWPNPELIGDAENFAGTGDAKNFETAEYTVSLSQSFDLSGKIRKRASAADHERRLAGWDYETTRLDLITSTRKAYAEVVAAQQNAQLARQLARLADDLASAVDARVQAGKVSPVEAQRIEVVKASAGAEALRADQEVAAARAALAALWGDSEPSAGWVAVEDNRVLSVPRTEAVDSLLADAPEAARWSDEIALREAELALARATAVPDVTASIGVRHFAENSDNALVAGLSVPLPVLNRNQGAIAATIARRGEAERRRAGFLARQRAEFQAAYNALRRADISLQSLDERIIPAAQSVFAATTIGYQAGKFNLIDLLDAQRTLFEAQLQRVSARAELVKAKADYDRLIAHTADAVKQPNSGS